MKNIIAFGASNSETSINKMFATHASNQLTGVTVKVLDLNHFELPLYSPRQEAEHGIPENAVLFDQELVNADGIVLSLAEHNGLHASVFKNLFDWMSRIDQKVWKNKPMLLLATSPGGRGGQNVLRVTKDLLPHYGGNLIADFSLPSFQKNFQENDIVDPELKAGFEAQIKRFQEVLTNL
ncbi:MAG: NAD(P)H-dependent FMN reductase [Flavobacteriales bacterium]|jgi:chromate reductase